MKAPWIAQAGLCVVVAATAASAQEKSDSDRAAGPASLKVGLAIHKQLDGKKLGTQSYTFSCPEQRGAELKFGVEVPVPVRKAEAVEFQYRNVGANIQCGAFRAAGGRYLLQLTLEQSSIQAPGDKLGTSDLRLEALAGNPPYFRTTMAKFAVMLRDGQTAQAVTGTDPMTGEVTSVDVTVTVEK
jgi:hypothetical protein